MNSCHHAENCLCCVYREGLFIPNLDIRRICPTKTTPFALLLDHFKETRKREDSKMVETDYGNVLKDEEILSLISNFEPKGTLFRAKFVSIMTKVKIRIYDVRVSVFSDPYDVICALITLRNNGVVSIDNNFTYLIKKYY